MSDKSYIAIDLKSFFASVECVERGLDPLRTHLVVADEQRTEKTICLAVTPSLKQLGIGGRARLFEVEQKVKQENARRKNEAPGRKFTGSSYDAQELLTSAALKLDYIKAAPRMAYYMDYSTRIYNIYLKYISAEDMHVYSIDEVFMDVTTYLSAYGMTPHELARKIIQDILDTTGITATAGIGANLYLCKIAMDIMAKKIPADEYGVRIAELDEMSYRRLLWSHTPLTDFWRVGAGYARKLQEHGMYTMGDIARCSVGKSTDFYNEDLLYKLFGVNAELLIDHAWGWEPVTIAQIKQYKPQSSSISAGQVLHCPYTAKKARLIVKEMTDTLVLELVDKELLTKQMVLTIGYDVENLSHTKKGEKYQGEVVKDRYGRKVPKHAHGTKNFRLPTSSTKRITEGVMELYDEIIDEELLVRRITIAACKLEPGQEKKEEAVFEQLDLFTDFASLEKEREREEKALEKEKCIQHAVLDIRKKYGKNALLKGMNLEEGATAIERNGQIGGHKA